MDASSLRIPTLAISFLFSVTFIAEAGTWSKFGYISEVVEYGDGVRIAGLDLSDISTSCSKSGLVRLDTSLSDASRDRINSLTLTAFASQKRVRVKVNQDKCSQDYKVFYAVQAANG